MCPIESHRKERSYNQVVQFPPIVQYSGSTRIGNFNPVNTATFKGRQVTDSSGHKRGRNGRYYSGGPFSTFLIKPVVSTRIVKLEGERNGLNNKYLGPICIPITNSGYSGIDGSVFSSSSSYLDPIGATAISIVDPTNPNSQLGVDLGEIVLDRKLPIPGIPTWERRTKLAKAAGSEYLNMEFGWKPLVDDMKNVAQSVKDGNKIMENYQAASGTLVHREFAFDDIVERSESVVSGGTQCTYASNAIQPAFHGTPAPLTLQSETTIKRWFSGSFIYADASPTKVGECLGIGSEADKLFGLTLTPDTIWQLTPWSWAADWFSNTGNVISNATSFGLAGLVMRYGYIMEEKSTLMTYHMPQTGLKGVSGPPPPAQVVFTTKRRREANPFGFGVSWEGLTPTQIAITAALGITRL
ncbi:TPA_asm: maturation protein [ssRNA phage Zoerhiza.4_21]|uniref:Maturation protein n=2 Tax=Leviviricetes TaxID=2842243 RepID=A0A8S5L2R1_9VIRU|nr:maturation protein [ssRNA phage Zoerhiza.4_21]QDH90940.1 MAG: hypothetical protein H4Rhizo45315_000003 [Leviviridae sp.]DAD51434.1 TPA_asm: maturation protein [ssRNA phage Zoerhiza.4_21]